ncbi:uncharacterized protein LOC110731780 [Chenopodium quinoa]|uniref:uncharacterized protein LOC110699911 n=1 Tax=Chenopodium quinoa TaxID=63459 RepID=UPI000B77CA85|nr:uncharacterized protein LOC110699911 [Chenopodium quinoa]XP_021760099.1 uncharacterized protein LOC110724922 [Chenopodium quinoa]XP_021760113.1 uncharacterized protein LOC110724929 [Chenopodium quinoa]XP_021762074.1 uncharacterized protein LOC110726863 [Chenopodium quinoa]XP_021762087.1 uncharacterized protein LOC110726877 [Chenopodium quinoa]XP_021767352.1 uncharacterized protein LOC110731780 [Chenopodium quinoa]
MESEQGNYEHEQNQTLQNDIKGYKRKEISLETLQSFWSKNMTFQEAAEQVGVSRCTMKRRLTELKLVWPSSKKRKQHLDDDAKKRKHDSKAPFGSDSTTHQNLVNPSNSTAHADIVGKGITGCDRHMLPNHVSSNSNAVGNLTMDTRVENVRENLMDNQRSEEH